jgi:hypothetical protein
VSFQHSVKIAKFERALPRVLSEASSQRWIVKDLRKALRERRSITGAKCESPCAEHLHECTEVGRDHWQPAQHVLGNDQAENFSTQGGNHDDRRASELGIKLLAPQTSCKPNAPGKRWFMGEAFKRRTLGPVADDEQLERPILRKQSTDGFEQDAHALGGDEPALKRDNRNLPRRCGMPKRLGNKFQTVRDRHNSPKLEQSAEPRGGSNIGRNALTQETADERQRPKLARSNPALAGIATEAFAMPAGHEVPRTRGSCGFDQKLSVRANRLKPVMLDNDGLAREKADNNRRQRRACHVNDVRSADQIPQFDESWLADNSKRKQVIVKFVRESLRRESDLEFSIAVG